MSNIIPKLNINKHPKNCDNNSFVDANNIIITDDGVIQNEPSFEYNEKINTDISNYLNNTDFSIVWCLPCNTEIVIFVNNGIDNKLTVFRYDETIDKLLFVTDTFVYHGGKLTGTFTYDVDNDLIVAISEFDNNENYPLRIINFGRILKDNDNYYIYHLKNNINQKDNYNIQCINPIVYLPTIKKGVYNGNWWKGWNYFFIRFKIDNNNYTQWYDLNAAIYTDNYNNFDLIRGRVYYNKEVLNNTTIKEGIQHKYITCANSDVICNIAPKLYFESLNNNSDNFSYYQIGVIICNKKQTLCKVTNDIDININIYSFNNLNVIEYTITDIIENTINIQSPKNIINYNNKLYISNYKENNYNIDLNDFVKNNFKFKLVPHSISGLKNDIDYYYYEYNSNNDNIYIIPIAKSNSSYEIYNITTDKQYGTFSELINLMFFPIKNGDYIPKILINSVDNIVNNINNINEIYKSNFPKYCDLYAYDFISDGFGVVEWNANEYYIFYSNKLNKFIYIKNIYDFVELNNRFRVYTKIKLNRNGQRLDISEYKEIDVEITEKEYLRLSNYGDAVEIWKDTSNSSTKYMTKEWYIEYDYIDFSNRITDKKRYSETVGEINIDNKGCFIPTCCYNLFIHFIDKYGKPTYGIPLFQDISTNAINYITNNRYTDYIGLKFIENDYVSIYVYINKNHNISQLYQDLLIENHDYDNGDWLEDDNHNLYIFKVIPKFDYTIYKNSTNENDKIKYKEYLELEKQNNFVEFPNIYFGYKNYGTDNAGNPLYLDIEHIYYYIKYVLEHYVREISSSSETSYIENSIYAPLFNGLYDSYCNNGFEGAINYFIEQINTDDTGSWSFKNNNYIDIQTLFKGNNPAYTIYGDMTYYYTLCCFILLNAKIVWNTYIEFKLFNEEITIVDTIDFKNNEPSSGYYWFKKLRYFGGYFWFNILNNNDYHINIPDDVIKQINGDDSTILKISKWKEYFTYLFNINNNDILDINSSVNIPVVDYKFTNIIDDDKFTIGNIKMYTNDIGEYLFSCYEPSCIVTQCNIPENYVGYFISYELFEDTYIPGKLIKFTDNSATDNKYNAKFITELGELEDSFKSINSIIKKEYDGNGKFIGYKNYNISNYKLCASGSSDNTDDISAFFINVDNYIETELYEHILTNRFKESLYNNKNKQLIPLSKYIYTTNPINITDGNYNGMYTYYNDIDFLGSIFYDPAEGNFNTSYDSYYNINNNSSINIHNILNVTEKSVIYNKSIRSKSPITENNQLIATRIIKVKGINDTDVQRIETTKYITPSQFKNLFQNSAVSVDEFYPKTLTNYKNDIEYKSEYNKTIRFSNIIQSESKIIGWRKFNIEHYKNINENKGIITNIVGIGNQILVHTEHSLFIFINNDSIEALNNNIKLSNTDILDINYKEMLTSSLGYGGLQYRDAWILGQYGYIYYDNDSKNIFKYDNNKLDVINSDIKLWIKDNNITDVKFADDKNNNRIIVQFIINNINNFVFSYNYLTNWWVCRHSYKFIDSYSTKNILYFNVNKRLITYNNKIRCKHYINGTSSNEQSFISIIVNDNYEIIKYLDVVEYKLYKILKLNTKPYLPNINNIDTNYAGDYIRINSEYLDTDLIDLTINTITDNNAIRDKLKILPNNNPIIFNNDNTIIENYNKPYWNDGNWIFNYIRDNVNNTNIDFSKKARIKGNWFVITFTFNNNDNKIIEFDTINYKLDIK